MAAAAGTRGPAGDIGLVPAAKLLRDLDTELDVR